MGEKINLRVIASVLLLSWLALRLEAQSRSFEVASVRVHQGGGDAARSIEAGNFRYTNVTLGELIIIAFGVKRYQIDGPDWVVSSTSDNRYDIVAKASENVPRSEIPQLLRPLLVERFNLQLHREMRDLPAYALTVAKGGPKLEAGAEGDSSAIPDGSGSVIFKNYPMSALATLLSNTPGVGRAVIDQTGLTGKFTFRANFFDTAPERSLSKIESNLGDGGDSASSPVFSNIQEQLGLKLEPVKIPTEMIVIDHVERTPTDN